MPYLFVRFLAVLSLMLATHPALALLSGFAAEDSSARVTADAVVLESDQPGLATARTRIAGPFRTDVSYRFSGVLDLKNPSAPSVAARTASELINFDARLACLVVRQIDIDGETLVEDASLGAYKAGTHPLAIEIATVPGVHEIELELRLSGLSGSASFRELDWSEGTRLYLPASYSVEQPDGKMPLLASRGEWLPPLAFQGQNLDSAPDARATIKESALPAQAGVPIVSMNAWFPKVTRQDAVANLETIHAAFPDKQIFIRVWLGAPQSFFNEFPEVLMLMDDGKHVPKDMATIHSEIWQSFARASIRELCLEWRKLPAVEKLAAIVPMYYLTGEWQIGDPTDPYRPGTIDYRFPGFNPIHRDAFAAWLEAEYGSLDALNAAWGSSHESFASVQVPLMEDRTRRGFGYFRVPESQQRVIDFSRFHSESQIPVIERFCREFKAAMHDQVLTGIFYGYPLEHSVNNIGIQQQGHLATREVLRSPDIDFFGSPYSYNSLNRSFGQPTDNISMADSIGLHGKPAFLEEDTYTHISGSPGKLLAPGEHLKTTTPEETAAVLKRNLGMSFARGYIHYWMSLLGDERFNLPEIWEDYRPYLEWRMAHPTTPPYRPEVALVLDEKAINYIAEDSRPILTRWLYELRAFLARTDTTLGVYEQGDLDRIPDSVRCLILATPYAISDEHKRQLRERFMRDGRMIVFGYLPGLYSDGRIQANSEDLTGIRTELVEAPMQTDSVVTDASGPLAAFTGQTFGEPIDFSQNFWHPNARYAPIRPHLRVTDESAETLARFTGGDGQTPSVVMKEMGDWTSVITAVHSLSPNMWRSLFAHAGVHLYLDSLSSDFRFPDVVEANSGFLMVQSGISGTRTVHLPASMSIVRDFQGMDNAVIARDTDRFEAEFEKGVPRFFLFE